MSNNKGSIVIVVIVIISVVCIWVGFKTLGNPTVPEYSSQQAGDAWDTYTIKDSDITFSYPPNWDVYEYDTDTGTIISVYPGNESEEVPDPNGNSVHISFYPNSIEDFAIPGPSYETNIGSNLSSVDREYTTESGDWWGRSMEWTHDDNQGVVWIGRQIDSLEYICVDTEGNAISLNDCDVSEGNTVVRTGTVSTDMDESIEKIIDSLVIGK